MEFLNAQMPGIEVLAVEIKRFHGTSAQTFVPRVIGRTAAGTRSPGRSGQRLTRESFLDGFDDGAVLAAEQVLSILAAETEDAAGGGEPITLGGETRFDRVSFRLARRQVT